MARELSRVETLTGREADVLTCLADGLSNNEIAERLFLSLSTVKWYVRQLNSKLDTANRDEIVQRARSIGLLDGDAPESVAAKHNLPHQTTPFIGREVELDELTQILALPEVQLVTVLAPGGMGKTRLALEAAEQQLYSFPAGVFFVPLQPLTEIEQIVPAIAQQVGFQFVSDERSLKQQLFDYLRGKQLLLVIDNWEHLLEGAPLVSDILGTAPQVKVLATSREKLNLSGETVYALWGMQYPTWETPEDALHYDAVKLLVQAAKRARPDFALTPDNLDYVARVCRLTEGMPLGILLATGWLDVLSLERIAGEIQKNVDFLETEMRDFPERQRSIRAIFAAAWDRLAPTEQQVFMKLAVFRGGCMPEAAETVTGASLRTLQTLVNKALVLRTKTGRCDIHELLRQYGYERLEASGTLADILRQHSAYYADFLHEREEDLKGLRQLEAMDEIETEVDNLRLAWYQALADQDMERIGQSAFPLTSYAEFRSRQGEFVLWLADAEEALRGQYAAHRDYGRLLADYGRTLYWLARTPEAEQVLQEALATARANADSSGIAYSALELSRVTFELGNRDEAWALVEESIRLCEQSGDDYSLALALFHQGYQLGGARRFDEMLAIYYRVLQIQRRLGDEVHVSTTLNSLAAARSWHGEDDETGAILLEGLELKKRLKLRNSIVKILGNLANWEIRHNRIEAARPYAEAALQIARETANPRDLYMALLLGVDLAVVSHQLDEAERLLAEVRLHWERSVEDHLYVLASTGDILLARGDWQGARAAFIACLKLKIDPEGVLLLGFAIAGAGQTERGLELVALAVNHPGFTKVVLTHPVGIHHLQSIKSQLTEEAYAAAWERGQALDFDATVAELLAEYGSDPSPI